MEAPEQEREHAAVTVYPLSHQRQSSSFVHCAPDQRAQVAEICTRYGLVVRDWGALLLVSARPTLIKAALKVGGVEAHISDSVYTTSQAA